MNSAEIIEFSSFAAARAKKEQPETAAARFCSDRRAQREARLQEAITSPENLTASCRNSRLRLSRRDVWWTASHLTHYWHARLEWWSALSIAQTHGIADANSYPKCDDYGARGKLVDLWRDALVQQMLTPAPDQNAVNWKRAQLAGRNASSNFDNPERLQRAIDADVEWLNNHPNKRSSPMSGERKEERRAFKEAMRQRIRDIAASRDLSDEEIKPALRLKHHEIANFTEKHGVNLEWLLEGKGRIFKKDRLGVKVMVREILQERDQ